MKKELQVSRRLCMYKWNNGRVYVLIECFDVCDISVFKTA
jgi:hypothetical protein